MCNAALCWPDPVVVEGVDGEPLLQDAADPPHRMGHAMDVLLPSSEGEQLTRPWSDPHLQGGQG